MKKTIAVLGFALVLGGAAQAQTFYGSLGFQSERPENANFSLSGFSGNVAAGYALLDTGSFNVEPRVGFGFSSSRHSEGSNSLTFATFGLNIDLLFKYNAGEFNVYAGPTVGLGRTTLTLSNGSNSLSSPASQFDFGGLLGFQYNLDSALGVFVEGSYLRNTYSDNSGSLNTGFFGVKVGATFGL